jgi:hypothetical protein
MKKSPVIKKQVSTPKALDYSALFREGIEWAQRYSGSVWTDYNPHDPGATILEYLCFGLTDVGYRCSFPVTDLLYAKDGQTIKSADNAFFPLHSILPFAPLTKDDYRRLILDHLMGQVDNVWVANAKNNKEGFKGLYDIFLQITPRFGKNKAENEREKVIQEVRNLFNAHRNLSEDIDQVYILQYEDLDLDVTISIESDASAEQVLADIAYTVEAFLAPKPKFYDFETLKESGMDVNDILDGPTPRNGFIKPEELTRFALSIRGSQIKNEITSVHGVVGISGFLVKIKSVPQRNDEIVLPKNTYFVLNLDAFFGNGSVRILRNGREVKPDLNEAYRLFLANDVKNLHLFRRPVDLHKPRPLSEKNLADVAKYFSIQRFFPAVYGIGAYGLPYDAGNLRQAQAKQLKAYLAIFEMMLAGYLKQLTRFRDLLSTGQEAEPTYFAQFPFDIPDVAPLIDFPNMETGDGLEASANQYLSHLATMGARDLERRNLFLDHLLARFAETFDADLLAQFSNDTDEKDQISRHLLKAKSLILQNYDVLSQKRGLGIDYSITEPIEEINSDWGTSWTNKNVSTLKKNICYRLNMPDTADRGLTDYFPHEFFDLQAKGSPENPAAISLRGLLQYGRNRSNYTVATTAESGTTVSILQDHKVEKILFKTESPAEEILKKFIGHLEVFHKNSNGFFIVEHLLLRPLHTKGSKLVLTVELPRQTSPFVMLGVDLVRTEALEGLEKEVLFWASNIENVEVRKDGKLFSIVLKSDTKDLMVSQDCYYEQEAFDIIQIWVQKMAAADSNAFKITAKEDTLVLFDPPHEFYAHRISVVAPTWTDTFSNKSARKNFRDLVRQLAPAHLYLEFHWFNFGKMRAFEADYKRWLQAKSGADNFQNLDAYSLAVAQHLQRDNISE